MHLNFHFTAIQILWTLTFAALLVLLVVLLGRDRVRRFPWFTASVVLMALRLLASRLLFGRLPELTMSTIFISLGVIMAVVGVLVVVELARQASGGIKWRTWIAVGLVMLAVSAGVLAWWGPWPSWKTLTADSALATLRLMQMAAQKGDLLVELLTVQLCLLVVLFGRRFRAGWRSHTQRILIGLSTAAIAQIAVQAVWQLIAMKAVAHSEVEYERILGLRDKLFNANGAVYVAVVVWWIVCLWIDEPRAGVAAEVTAGAAAVVDAEAVVDEGKNGL